MAGFYEVIFLDDYKAAKIIDTTLIGDRIRKILCYEDATIHYIVRKYTFNLSF